MLQIAVAASAVLAIAAAQGVPGECDQDFDCNYIYTSVSGVTYNYNFLSLCNDDVDYVFNDTAGHTYSWNICGYANKKCLPQKYTERYTYGTAVQSFGTPPPCNTTNSSTMCFNYVTNQTECCTEDCAVLGTGVPTWRPIRTNNPATGGVRLTYYGVPANANFPYGLCPNDTMTGAPQNRQVTFFLYCDASVSTVEVLNVTEVSTCSYEIKLSSSKACGCSPKCRSLGQEVTRICGDDGCGGYCSGPDLKGGCPDYKGVAQTCDYASGLCSCRSDCSGRQCGGDGCGGYCGTQPEGACEPGLVCTSSQMCVPVVIPGPTFDVVYTRYSPGLYGGFFGGVFSTIGVAFLGWFYLGKGRERFDKWRFAGEGRGDGRGLLNSPPVGIAAQARSSGGGYGSSAAIGSASAYGSS